MRQLALGLLLVTTGCTADESSGNPPPTPGDGEGIVRGKGCGNGVLNGVEPCDGDAFAGAADCAGYGLGAGSVICSSVCTLDFTGCANVDYCTANSLYGDGNCDPCELLGGMVDGDCATACGADGTCADGFDTLAGVYVCQNAGLADPDCGGCGDMMRGPNELCDGTDFRPGATSCGDYGFDGGSLLCSADCLPDFIGCTLPLCGNGVVDSGEQCDGQNLAGGLCTNRGYSSGQLACSHLCLYDESDCRRSNGPADFAALWDGLCDHILGCGASYGATFTSASACRGFAAASFACNPFPGDFAINQSVVSACAAAIRAAPCVENFFETAFTDPACEGLISSPGGIAPIGGACFSAPCIAGSSCIPNFSGGGLCASCEPNVGPGSDCSNARCAAGNWCDANARCVATLANGSMCGDDDECQSAMCILGTCNAPLPTPSPCDEHAHCQSGVCYNGQCFDPLPPGSMCQDGDQCAGNFRECIGGACVERAGPGGPCTDSEGCFLDHHCAAGICVGLGDPCTTAALGESCNTRDCAPGLRCDGTDTCVALTPVGSNCSSFDECGEAAYCEFASSQCMAYIPAGGACASGRCAQDAFCDNDPMDPRCRAEQPLGSACTDSSQCDASVCFNGECSPVPACP